MKRNSGRIGIRATPGLSAASGMFDTFDAYNLRRNGSWPLSFRYNSLSINSGTINENTATTFTFNTAGFESNTTLFWTVLNGTTTSSDFFGSVVSGSFTQSGSTNTGSFTVNTNLIGNTAKTTRTFQIQIRTDSVSGPVVYTSGTFSIPAITSTVSWSITPVNEGSTTNLQVTLGNIGSLTTYTANISYGGTAGAGDFSTLPTSMSIGSGTASITYTSVADFTTEGSETLIATVTFGGFTLGNPTLTISDTSLTRSASLSHAASVDEGANITFTVNTTNFPSGTLFYTLENVSNWSASDVTATSGSFAISGSTGNFTVTTVADGFTEGAEIFLVRVRVDSTSGTIIGSSSNVTINDTSTGAPPPSELYAFTTVTFGAGTTANLGPTLAQVQAAMTGTPTPSTWNTNAANLSVTSGIILWTVPSTASYRITAEGASGSPASTTNRGASIRGDFSLTQGQKLRIVVGQIGSGASGGGGGSYVIRETGSTVSDIFVIGGGGGGKSGGAAGQAGTANSSGSVSNGNGGLANAGSWNGPAGGGFFTSGTVSTGSPRGNVGSGFLQGSAGGAATPSGAGGFGGGGSGGADSAAGGGGGGGYSGGSGGPDGSNGQGAGSYPNGTNQVNTANSRSGGGQVIITKL
jgi:hypothetical protein